MTGIDVVNSILTILTLVAQVGFLFLVILLASGRGKTIVSFVRRHAILLAFIVAVVATTGSLFYSEVAGFLPCKLCWFQRIVMYPQAILLGLAFWKGDKKFADYSIALSLVGAFIASYHYLLQIGVVKTFSCGVVGYSVSCSDRFVMHLGYLTIPMMALSGFLLILALMFSLKQRT